GEQLRLGNRTARVFRHDLDLLARRDLLQFDELGQQPPDRHGIAHRQLRAAALGDLQPDLVRRQEAKAARDGIDQRRVVARDDAEMVADAIGDAGWQLHLEDRKSTRLNSSHVKISYAVFCLKKKTYSRSHA